MEIDITQLCNYAYGFLPKQKMEEIRQAIEQEPDLRYQYEGILEIMRRFPDKDPEEVAEEMAARIIAKVQAQVQEATSSASPQKKGRMLSMWPALAAAASILIVIGIYLFNNEPTAEQMAMNYVQETPSLETGRDSSYNQSSWREYWEQKDFTRVVNLLAANETPAHTESFVLGVAYLRLDPPQYTNAKKSFNLTLTNGMVYRSKSNFYLGVIEILEHHPEAAIPYLSASSEPSAQLLLKRLKAR